MPRAAQEDMRSDTKPGARFPDCQLLGVPELRAAWARGEKERFWPYGMTLRQSFAEGDEAPRDGGGE
jgi:hypothetical protein